MGAPISTIQYGSVTFPYTSLDVQSGVLYDTDRKTKIGVRYVFRVSGWVGGADQGSLQTTIASMQAAVTVPRQEFTVRWSPEAAQPFFQYNATANEPISDLDWGPRPGQFTFTKFSGGRAAMYTWECEVNTYDHSLSSDVLSIVWSFQHSIDPSGFTTRTVTGKLLVDSGTVNNQQSADHYRSIITNALPVPQWFKREKQEWSQDETGRVLTFAIVDQEYNWTPPIPITRAEVSWTVRIGGYQSKDGLLVDYVLSGFMESSAAHTKNEILAQIFNLAAIKFGSIGSGTLIFGERMISEDIFKSNMVRFQISAQGTSGTGPNGEVDYTVGLSTFGIAPPNSDGQPILINPYGQTGELSSGLVAPSAPIWDPTTQQAQSYQFPNQSLPTNTIDYQTNPINAPQGSGYPPVTSGVSKTTQQLPIIAMHEEISYTYDNHMVMLPCKVANQPPIVQQTANPTVHVVQAGYIKQVAKTANGLWDANDPCYNSPQFVLAMADISTSTPEPIGDGSYNLYTTSWRYMLMGTQVLTATLPAIVPVDPRRVDNASQVQSIQTVPKVLELPSQMA